MLRLLSVLGVVALCLAGCATVTNSLSPEQIAQIKITDVRVSFAANARIDWDDAEQELMSAQPARKSAEGPAPAVSPEVAAAIRKRTADLVRRTLVQRVLPAFSAGQRAAVLDVEIRSLLIPSAARRIIAGGQPGLSAVTTLRDAVTGAVLASTDQPVVAFAGQGIGGALFDAAFRSTPMMDDVLNLYTSHVLGWLQKK